MNLINSDYFKYISLYVWKCYLYYRTNRYIKGDCMTRRENKTEKE